MVASEEYRALLQQAIEDWWKEARAAFETCYGRMPNSSEEFWRFSGFELDAGGEITDITQHPKILDALMAMAEFHVAESLKVG